MKTKRLHLYSIYERVWHWIQAAVILVLLLTGLEIHNPDGIAVFGFRAAVSVHTAMGFLLLINAVLGLFYHLTTAKIREYLPEPRDFISQAIAQVVYYSKGIFRGDAHPFERTPGRKLNPLQQLTYLGILNILLPLQMVTGFLMWGLQVWPEVGRLAGGLPFLGPLHTLSAWFFAAFLLMHLYLTTTGETPMTNMKAMVTGYEDVEDANEEEAP
jgi:thiosulfate reductase cytochrome b subunit